MDDSVRKVLEERAITISQYLRSAGYVHSYRLIEYGINFTFGYAGNEHVMSIFYSPKKQRWTSYAVNEQVRDVILPKIQSLLAEIRTTTSHKQAVTLPIPRSQKSSTEDYFSEALENLRLLEPFARENIDFSILYDLTRRGVILIMKDRKLNHLNQQALQTLLDQPIRTDFQSAKEYVFQCLTRCNFPTDN
jgi:hypothetical protein